MPALHQSERERESEKEGVRESDEVPWHLLVALTACACMQLSLPFSPVREREGGPRGGGERDCEKYGERERVTGALSRFSYLVKSSTLSFQVIAYFM
jgi:hypothetical protein